jgi:uncharacterized repeat protein (TIGR01451 family)
MTMFRAFLALILLWMPAVVAAQAVPVLTWSFAGPVQEPALAAPSPIGDGIVPIPLATVGGEYQSSSDRFRARNWNVTNAPKDDQYLSWGFETSHLYALDSISLRLERDGSGPQSFRLDIKIDDGEFETVGTGTIPPFLAQTTLDLDGRVVTSRVEFRFYPYDYTGGRLYLESSGSGVEDRAIIIRGTDLGAPPPPPPPPPPTIEPILTWRTSPGTPEAVMDAAATPRSARIDAVIPVTTVGGEYQARPNEYRTRNWDAGPVVDLTKYVQFGLTADKPLVLADLYLRVMRSASGPTDYRVDMKVDGGSFQTVGSGTVLEDIITQNIFDLGEVVVTEEVVFRVHPFGGGSGRFSLIDHGSSIEHRAIIMMGREVLLASLSAEKVVSVVSETGADCSDLGAAPSGDPLAAAVPGACVEYLIEITNTGESAAENVLVTTLLPGMLTVQAAGRSGWDETAPAPDAFAFTSACDSGGCTVEIANGKLAVGATATVTIRATIH